MKKLSKVFLGVLLVFVFSFSFCLTGCFDSKSDDYVLDTFYLGEQEESEEKDTHFLYIYSDKVLAFGLYNSSFPDLVDEIAKEPAYCYNITKLEKDGVTTYHAENQAEEGRFLDITFENKTKAVVTFQTVGDSTLDVYVLNVK